MIKTKKEKTGLQDAEVQGMYVPEMQKVFLSYHFISLDLGRNGFGNMVTAFNPSLYKDDDGKLIKEKFIADLQKTVEMTIKSELGFDAQARILFYQ